MATALLIGGHGFIGSNLVACLLAEGHQVRIFCREQAELNNLRDLQVEVFHGDLTDRENLPKLLSEAARGCQWVFNLATCGSSLEPYRQERQRVNVEAARQVAQIVREVGKIRLVHVSSSTAVGFPFSGGIADEEFSFNAEFDDYARSKRLGEDAVLQEVAQGLDSVIAIPGSTIGVRGMKANQKEMVQKVMAGKARICPPGGLCLTDVDDLVQGLSLCAEKGVAGRRYILGGENILYRDYLGEIARAAGSAPPRLVLPKVLLPFIGRTMELIGRLTGKELAVDRNVARMIASNLYYSSRRAEEELGYRISGHRKTLQKVVAGLQKQAEESNL